MSAESKVVQEHMQEFRQKLTELVKSSLSETYHCTRDWSAWSFGTMSQDDFESVNDSDTPEEIVEAIIGELQPSAAIKQAREALEGLNHMGGDERGGYCICPLNDGSAPDSKHASSCAGARSALRALGGSQ